MKHLLFIITALLILSCSDKKKQTQDEPKVKENDSLSSTDQYFSEEELEYDQEKTKSIKRQHLITIKDDKVALQEVIVDKRFTKEADQFVLDYKYPYLNEDANPQFKVFNDAFQEKYLNIEKTENEILDDREMLCDSINGSIQKDKRIMNYKVYQSKNDLLSILIYKENYYSGMKHSTYSFDCLNFDLKKQQFLGFDAIFKPGSHGVILNKINTIITTKINKGEMYYDCWEITEGDFGVYKDNFVIKDDAILYYFDDCVVCPSYTGTYYVSIPIKDIMDYMIAFSETAEVS